MMIFDRPIIPGLTVHDLRDKSEHDHRSSRTIKFIQEKAISMGDVVESGGEYSPTC
jgi:hypothetical protein